MRPTFHLTPLVIAAAALSVVSVTHAAGLDRSGQDITAFLQDGLYAEASYTYIDGDVTGYDSANLNPNSKDYVKGNKIGDIAESYDFFRYGVKTDINDTFSVGILYDEPFGAAADYRGDNNFVAKGDLNGSITKLTDGQFNGATIGTEITRLATIAANTTISPQERAAAAAGAARLTTAVGIARAEAGTAGEGTNVEVRSENVTAILGAKFGANKNFQVYGGPVAQRLQADVKLRGLAYGPASGYTAHVSPDQDYGWLAGVSYSKPEIALKAALTYRSEIDHNAKISETYPIVGIAAVGSLPEGASQADIAAAAASANRNSVFEVTTPKSVNFDFQTGINKTTLATAKVRWVPWGDFSIVPPLYNDVSKGTYGPDGLALVDYDDDQWQVELGMSKRLSPALALSGTVGWDSGAGDTTTSLGPVDGYYSAGLGAKYNLNPNWAVSAGGKYLWFGDAKGQLPTKKIVGNFEDNDGYVLGVKLSYQATQNFK